METTALNTGLTFGEPLWLWALLLVPALGALFFWAQAKRRTLLSLIVAPRLREQLASGVNPLLRGTRAVLVLLTLALVLVALAKPRMGTIQREIKSNGRDVLIAIDTSRSMLATDVAPTRLQRAKLLSEDLINLLQGDRIGIVAFAGSAFLQAPLTLDYNAVRTTLDELDTNVIPRGGTDIAAAINTAMSAFGKAEGVLRALIIMTDGEDLDGNAVDAAKKAAAQGIKVFTIGIGSPQGSLIPIRTDDGRNDYVRDEQGKPVQSRLDEKRLAEIAQATGGFYAPLSPDVARKIYDDGIEPMATRDTGMLSTRVPIEQYQWPLGGALVCFVLWMLIGEGRSRFRIGSRKAAAHAVVAGLTFLVTMAGAGAAESGLQQYQKGDYKGALTTFEQNATVTPEKEKAQFDAGAAAYKGGDYAKAITHFTSALLADDDSLRASASYNLGNSLVRRGEQAKSDESKEKDWKDAIAHYDETLKIHPNDADAKANREITKKLLEDLKKKQDQQKQQQQQQQNQQQNQQNKNDQQKQDQQQNKDQKQDQQNKQDQQQKDQQGQQQKQNDQQKQDQKNQQNQQQNGSQQQKDQQQQNQSQGQQNKPDQNQQQQNSQNGKDQQQKQDQQNQQQNGSPKDQQQQNGSQDQQSQSQPQPGQGNQPRPTPQPSPGEKKQGDLKAAQPDQQKQGDQQQQAVPMQPDKDGEMSEAQARALLRSMQGEEERVRLLERQQNQDVIKDW
jgi:Ca-activated chloride channel family protein